MDKLWLSILFVLFVMTILAAFIAFLSIDLRRPSASQELSESAHVKLKIKKSLMDQLERWIQEASLNEAQISVKLGIEAAIVANIFNHQFETFTIERLIELLTKTGKPFKIVIDSNIGCYIDTPTNK